MKQSACVFCICMHECARPSLCKWTTVWIYSPQRPGYSRLFLRSQFAHDNVLRPLTELKPYQLISDFSLRQTAKIHFPQDKVVWGQTETEYRRSLKICSNCFGKKKEFHTCELHKMNCYDPCQYNVSCVLPPSPKLAI